MDCNYAGLRLLRHNIRFFAPITIPALAHWLVAAHAQCLRIAAATVAAILGGLLRKIYSMLIENTRRAHVNCNQHRDETDASRCADACAQACVYNEVQCNNMRMRSKRRQRTYSQPLGNTDLAIITNSIELHYVFDSTRNNLNATCDL